MNGLAVNLVRAASEMGQLFGSVTSRDIAEAVTDAGFTITRDQVVLDKAIKALGLTDVRIRLHPEVSVEIVVNIARTLEEAKTQLKTGSAVTGDADNAEDLVAAAVDAIDANEADDAREKDTDVDSQ